ncbi:MAG: hypothetical protein AAFP70_21280 [Calditrichota bacterium]
MTMFRTLLIILTLTIFGYTTPVTIEFGLNILPLFFGEISAMTWQGQFNLDFLCFLILSAAWLMWRYQFSGKGIIFGILGLILGMSFLAPFLLVISYQTNGNMRKILMGEQSDK